MSGEKREPSINVSPSRHQAHTGVDVTLIDEMLSLSPTERLRQNDRMLRTIRALRAAFQAQLPPNGGDEGR